MTTRVQRGASTSRQVKGNFGPAKLAASYQWFNDRSSLPMPTPRPYDGTDIETFAKNKVIMLKGEGTRVPVDLKAALYRSAYKAPLFDQRLDQQPEVRVNGTAYKIDVGLNNLLPGLGLNFQLFNIGAGYYSNTGGALRERRAADRRLRGRLVPLGQSLVGRRRGQGPQPGPDLTAVLAAAACASLTRVWRPAPTV
jgi:hypothetical protein